MNFDKKSPYGQTEKPGVSSEEILKKASYLKHRNELDPREYRISIQQIQDMATGGNPENIRQYYANWSNKDFLTLLDELGESHE